jgi:hypothetical protein
MSAYDQLSTDARELVLYAENTEELYAQFLSIIANVKRKITKGTYNPDLAPKLWRYWVDEAAKRYKREFGSNDWNFPVPVRNEAAAYFAATEHESILNGEYDA